jgi:hypothetical protein
MSPIEPDNSPRENLLVIHSNILLYIKIIFKYLKLKNKRLKCK